MQSSCPNFKWLRGLNHSVRVEVNSPWSMGHRNQAVRPDGRFPLCEIRNAAGLCDRHLFLLPCSMSETTKKDRALCMWEPLTRSQLEDSGRERHREQGDSFCQKCALGLFCCPHRVVGASAESHSPSAAALKIRCQLLISVTEMCRLYI